MYAACADAVGGRVVPVPPRAGLLVPARRHPCGHHAATRGSCTCEPEQPDAAWPSRARTSRRVARAAAGRRAAVPRRGLRGVRARHLPGRAGRRCPNVVVGRTFAKAYGLAARARRVRGRAARRDAAAAAGACRPYSVNVFAVDGDVAALEDATTSTGTARRWPRRASSIYAPASGSDSVLAERGELRAGPRRRRRRGGWCARWPRAASSSAIVRAQPGCAGCVRITAGVVEHTERVRGGDGGGAMRRAVIERKTRGDADPRSPRHRGQGPRTGVHRHPVPRPHAGAGRAPRRVRPRSTRAATSTWTSTTRSRTWASRSARPCRGARHRRGINRAGYFVMPMDETLAVAAIDLGGPAARRGVARRARAAAWATSRPSSCTTSSRASRSARAATCT